MRVWLLRPVENLPRDDDPWDEWWERTHRLVVRAPDKDTSRRLAHEATRGQYTAQEPADGYPFGMRVTRRWDP